MRTRLFPHSVSFLCSYSTVLYDFIHPVRLSNSTCDNLVTSVDFLFLQEDEGARSAADRECGEIETNQNFSLDISLVDESVKLARPAAQCSRARGPLWAHAKTPRGGLRKSVGSVAVRSYSCPDWHPAVTVIRKIRIAGCRRLPDRSGLRV